MVSKVGTLNEIDVSDTLIFHFNPVYHELAVWNVFAFLMTEQCFLVTRVIGKVTRAVEIKHDL